MQTFSLHIFIAHFHPNRSFSELTFVHHVYVSIINIHHERGKNITDVSRYKISERVEAHFVIYSYHDYHISIFILSVFVIFL